MNHRKENSASHSILESHLKPDGNKILGEYSRVLE